MEEKLICVNLPKGGFSSTSYFGGWAEEMVYLLLSMIQEKSYYHVDTWPVLVFVNKCVTSEAILMGGFRSIKSDVSPFHSIQEKEFQ